MLIILSVIVTILLAVSAATIALYAALAEAIFILFILLFIFLTLFEADLAAAFAAFTAEVLADSRINLAPFVLDIASSTHLELEYTARIAICAAIFAAIAAAIGNACVIPATSLAGRAGLAHRQRQGWMKWH